MKNNGPRKTFFRVVGFPLAAIAVLSCVLALIVKVRSGHSLDTYRNGILAEWNYASALTMIAVVVIALLVAWLTRYLLALRERREIKRVAESRPNDAK